jgi:hypothetical protein
VTEPGVRWAWSDSDDVTRWIDGNAHPLSSLDPRLPLADLEPLAHLVSDATVVGLGASTRGAHELSILMHRALRFLVEDMGFRSLAVEDDWTTGIQINEYLRTGNGDPRALVADAWLPFRTEEFVDVIRWMRSFNERHPADPVRFVGVDINRVRSVAYDAVAEYVRMPRRTGLPNSTPTSPPSAPRAGSTSTPSGTAASRTSNPSSTTPGRPTISSTSSAPEATTLGRPRVAMARATGTPSAP